MKTNLAFIWNKCKDLVRMRNKIIIKILKMEGELESKKYP